MSRTKKEKLETHTDISLQVVPEIFTEENAVTAADGYNLEKRKKEAGKPLYLRRM